MQNRRKTSCAKVVLWSITGLIGVCLLLSAISAFFNSRMPTQSPVTGRLTDSDKARLAEVGHLRQTLGEEIIPGWARAEIPIILYNEQYVFLVGYPDPPDGWEKIPNGQRRGSAWEPVPGDTFQGQPYYRQAVPGPGQQPESFTVRVGDRWVASLMTLDWFKISLANQFRADMPAPLKAVFPYPLAVNLLMGSSEQYMTSIHHEAAHAYQGMRSPAKLAAAETAANTLNERYPWDDEKLAADWQSELNCLRDAVRAKTEAGTRAQALRFIDLRQARRGSARLAAELVDLERKREWEEGFAKYAEMSVYRLAANTPGYAPVPDLKSDIQFHHYRDFSQRWQNEVNQIATIGRQKDEIRFYYAGWAQSELLDRLSPGWKARLFDEDIWLEDLLAGAVR